jgi:soluble lytic murein transglycosylase
MRSTIGAATAVTMAAALACTGAAWTGPALAQSATEATPAPAAAATPVAPSVTTPPPARPFTPAPQPTPVPVPFAPVVAPTSPIEAARQGLRAADRGDWSTVRSLIAMSGDANVRGLLLWRLVTADSMPGSFSEHDQALRELRAYPQRRTIRIRAEERIGSAGLTPAAMVAFLTRKEAGVDHDGPISGEGKLELAGALMALGRTEEARRWLSDGWRNHRLDVAGQARYLARFSGQLTAEDHDARVDFLLWAERRTQARPLLPLMSPQERDHAQRRMGIQTGEGAVLFGSAIDDRGIQYERVRDLRRQEQRGEALALLTQIDSRGLPEPGQDALWTERRNLLIEAITTKDWRAAYRIASTHGYSRGERFADGEFVAGWVALRFLNEPQTALKHFTTLEAGVSTPVSKARGSYWLGRTAEALGRPEEAQARYAAAAAFPTVYYGQLAAVRLGRMKGQVARLQLPPERRATDADRIALERHPTMGLVRMLADFGETALFRQFALALDDELTSEGEHQALSEFARARGEPQVGIRVAKAGLNRGVIATEAAYPVIPIPRIVGYGQAETAFALAITRQESEFNTRAVSGANARGLMQFLPATAASQARRMGVPHQTDWLISRPEHNLMLGSAHLHDLTENFGGSYVMAIAAYNAGPGRPRQWVQTYGDLRETDLETAIDWVEKIPFSETRNYVQRVLENMQVYRARLNGDNAPIGLAEDLTRGRRPPPIFPVIVAPEARQGQGAAPSSSPPAPTPRPPVATPPPPVAAP